jgi:hypothetical protein
MQRESLADALRRACAIRSTNEESVGLALPDVRFAGELLVVDAAVFTHTGGPRPSPRQGGRVGGRDCGAFDCGWAA